MKRGPFPERKGFFIFYDAQRRFVVHMKVKNLITRIYFTRVDLRETLL